MEFDGTDYGEMARASNKLTALTVRNAREPGRYSDGGNLTLVVTTPDRRWWQFRYTLNGRAREMSLGNIDHVTLAQARQKALDAHRLIAQGVDPLDQRKAAAVAEAPAVTFAEAAESYIAGHEAAWSNKQHRYQWRQTIEQYANPVIGKLSVTEIGMREVLAVLKPIWTTKTETAVRLRGRIECILAYATVHDWRPEGSSNPAVWRGCLQMVLPAPGKISKVEHHAALAWRETPEFMSKLARQGGIGALALRFAILTAARSGEVRLATWSEIKDDAWTVPAARMKARREHRQPFSEAAQNVLRDAAGMSDGKAPDALIFPGQDRKKPLSDMSLTAVLRRMGRGDLTAHGFRSTFRDWCAEATDYPSEVAEMALAHAVGDKVEAAYRRGDLFEKRRALMNDWAAYCASGAANSTTTRQRISSEA